MKFLIKEIQTMKSTVKILGILSCQCQTIMED